VRSIITTLVGITFGMATAASAQTIAREGGRVTVETDRYVATIEQGALVGLKSKLTGETFAEPSTAWTKQMRSYVHGAGVTNIDGKTNPFPELNRLHQWYGGYATNSVLSTVLHPHEESEIVFESLAKHHAKITWRGLRGFAPDRDVATATYTLDVLVLEGSGDLQLTPSVEIGTAGVYGCSLLMANFSRELRVISPEGPGVAFAASDGSKSNVTTMRWPSPWHASIVIGESKTGSFGLWMAEASLGDRQLHRRHRDDGWDVSFQATSAAPFDKLTAARGYPVRVNVYAGNWTQPAKAFREWWSSTHGVKPLAERKPAWLKDLAMLARSGDTLPPREMLSRTLVFGPQDWQRTSTVGDIGLFPHDMRGPELNSIAGKMDEIRAGDGRLMVYFNITDMNEGHPLAAKFWDKRLIYPFDDPKDPRDPVVGSPSSFFVHPAYVPWQEYQLDWAKRMRERFGINGVYWDVAGGRPQNSTLGQIRGMNPNQGQVELMRRWSAAGAGETFGAVEYLNEVTAIAADIGFHGYDTWTFAGGLRVREQQAHPIVAFLYGPYTQLTWYNRNESATLNEVLGRLPVWGDVFEPASEWVMDRSATKDTSRALIDLRLRERITPVFPEKWGENVRAYYVDASGRRYEVVAISPVDTEMVRVENDGTRSVLYRRASGAESIEVPSGRTIEGWIAYAGDRAIGLDPEQRYFVCEGAKIDDWRVKSLPAGVRVARARAFDDRVVVKLASEAETKGRVVVETTHAAKWVVTNDGATEVKDAKHLDVAVTSPGVVAVMTDDPKKVDSLKPGERRPLSELPWRYAAWNEAGVRVPFKKDGMVSGKGESMTMAAPWLRRASVDCFVELPSVSPGQKLIIDLGTLSFGGTGSAISTRLIINGQVVGQQSFNRVVSAEMPSSDITRFAGQRVLMTIELDDAYMKTPLTMSSAVMRVE
jgi:hypothetical protein